MVVNGSALARTGCIGEPLVFEVGESLPETLDPPSRPRRHVLLRHRDLAILVGGQWVSQVGNNLFSLALYWYVLSHTSNPSALAWVGAATTLPNVLGLLTGVFVDRVNRRSAMMASDAIRATLSLAMAALAWLHWLPLWGLLVFVFCLAVAGTFFQPASMAMIPTIVEPEDLPQANGLSQAASNTAGIVGAAAGGALMAVLGPVLLFFLNGLSFLVSVATLGLLRPLPPPETARGRDLRVLYAEWREGFAHIRQDAFLTALIATSVFINFALQNVNVFVAAWVRDRLHGTAFGYGLMDVGLLLGVVAGSLSAAAALRRLGQERLVTLGLLALGSLIVLYAELRALAAAVAAFVLLGAVVGLINTGLFTGLQKRVPLSLQGRVFGTLVALASMANPLGAVAAGLLARVLPIATIFLLVGTAVFLAGLPLTRFWRESAGTAATG
jgi:DHA3 family macrolide efflux protein-like MFS transporter